jgi:hypothetical protein
VTGAATPNTSGAFEIVDDATKKSYHSKLNGDGHMADDRAKTQKVIDAIKADL